MKADLKEFWDTLRCSLGFHALEATRTRECMVQERCTRPGCDFERYDVNFE